MPRYLILDLDNCIADDAHRVPLIAWGRTDPTDRYSDYHSLCGTDTFENRYLVDDAVARRLKIIILTGRPLIVRAQTEAWLRRNEIRYAHLIMRNNADTSRSADLKRKMVGWLEAHYGVELSEIDAAYDDHPAILEMYRSLGIQARQAKIHDLDAYTNPFTKEES